MVEESVQFNTRQREVLLQLNLLLNEINEMTNDSEIDKKILELSVLLWGVRMQEKGKAGENWVSREMALGGTTEKGKYNTQLA